MYQASFGEYEIVITNEVDFTPGSADNTFQYEQVYQHPEDEASRPTSSCGIKVYKDGLYKTAIVMESGGGTQVSLESVIIDGEHFLLTCSNKVFNLHLPDLKLDWIAVPDWATCFSIHQYKDSYIVRGETSVARLSQSGDILWKVEARDIFVNIEHVGDTFQMHDDYIALMDWEGYRYRLFYDGTMIDDGMAPRMAPNKKGDETSPPSSSKDSV